MGSPFMLLPVEYPVYSWLPLFLIYLGAMSMLTRLVYITQRRLTRTYTVRK